MGFEKLLRTIIYGAIGIALVLVPLLVTNSTFFPYIVGKNVLFRLLVEVALGAWMILALRDVWYRPRRSWILWTLLAFVVVIGIANLFGINPRLSFWSVFERMDGYVTLLHFGAYVLVASSVLRTERAWRAVLNVAVAGSVLVSAYALFQTAGVFAATGVGGGTRVAGTFGNAIYLAGYMLVHAFLTLILLVRHEGSRWVRPLYIGALFLQVVTLFLTQTRGAILGLFGGFVLSALLIALFEHRERSYRNLARGTLVTLVLLGALFFAARDSAFVQRVEPLQRLATISLEEGTARSRLLLWGSIALEGFKERPLLGWGQENFGSVFSVHYDPRMVEQEPWFDRAHNVILDWLVAGGVLGLTAYLALLLATLVSVWRAPSAAGITEKALLTGLLAGYFFHNLFVFDNVVSYLLFGTVLAYVHTRSFGGDGGALERAEPRTPTAFQYVGYIVVPLLVALAAYTYAIKPTLAARALLGALRAQPSLEDNLAHYERALSYDTVGGEETVVQLFQLAVNVIASPDVPDELKRSYAVRAIEAGETLAENARLNARYDLFFGTFLMRVGLFPEALTYLTRARETSPKKQQILTTLAQYHFITGDVGAGLMLLEESYNLAPELGGAAAAYASALIGAGDVTRAEAVLEERYGTVLITEPEVIQAYAAAGRAQALVDRWVSILTENPTDARMRLSFAYVLATLGDQAAAVEQATLAAEIDPTLAADAAVFIDSLGQTPA